MLDSYVFSVFILALFVLLIYIPFFKGFSRLFFSINVPFADLIPAIFFPELFNSLLLNYIYQKGYLDNINPLLSFLIIMVLHSFVLFFVAFFISRNIQKVNKKFFKVYVSLFISKMSISLFVFIFYKYLS